MTGASVRPESCGPAQVWRAQDDPLFPVRGPGGRRPVVAIVAPSGYAADPLDHARADAQLQAQGCEVRHYDDPQARHQRFAATDSARLAGLHAAADDPEVDVIIALRGGYGVSRLMPDIDFKKLAASKKLIVGHSDFTALQMGLLCHGGTSFAGPTICSDFALEDVSAITMRDFWRCLSGPSHGVRLAGSNTSDVDAQGILWGGNLAMLAHLVGSPWLPAVDGGILFLEDINEHPFRVERMLLQLLYAGVLEKQAAIVLGDFSGARTADYDNGYDFAAMLEFIGSRTTVPIVTGLPFGHMRDKVTLAVGSRATLRNDGGAVSLTMFDYPLLGDPRA